MMASRSPAAAAAPGGTGRCSADRELEDSGARADGGPAERGPLGPERAREQRQLSANG